jgi:tetratricopeptide (TPR) repeat protein
LVEAGTYAEAGREAEAFALVEEARTQLPTPFDGLAPVGEVQIYTSLEDPDALEATLPALEAFITNLQAEILRPVLIRGQGMVHELRGEYREAIDRYQAERQLLPARTSILVRIARCHRELGEYDDAISLFQEALTGDPFSPRTNYELALTYEAMGGLDDARMHLNRALEVWAEADPTYKWALRAREAAERIGG